MAVNRVSLLNKNGSKSSKFAQCWLSEENLYGKVEYKVNFEFLVGDRVRISKS